MIKKSYYLNTEDTATIEAMDTVRDRLVQTRNNEEFLLSMNG